MIACWQASSWALFGDAILTGLLVAALLPMLGVVLVLRQQVFVAAAIGQAATLGIAVVVWLGVQTERGPDHSDGWQLAAGLLAAAVAAVTALRSLSLRGSAAEARAVWMFLFAGSASMLLLAGVPHGLQQVQQLFLSSVLGASPLDSWVAATLLLVAIAALCVTRRRLWLWATDPVAAAVYGSSVRTYDIGVGIFVGIVIGFAIHATGLTFTFGCTILPVLLVRELAPSLLAVTWSAPAAGVLAHGIGFWCADRADLPPGQTTVAVLGAGVVLAGGTRVLLRRRALSARKK
jgi:ABC-type Mn2+/Zn2+ transport system permease subunit